MPVAALGVDDAAVQLFLDRAAAVDPGFAPSADDHAAIAEVGCLLDGLPLAIELAAARTLSRTPAELLGDLQAGVSADDRRRADRHRSVDATIDWSYELLSAEEQTVYRSMAVFAGGWTPARRPTPSPVIVAAWSTCWSSTRSSSPARSTVGRGSAMLEPSASTLRCGWPRRGGSRRPGSVTRWWAADFMEQADAGLRTPDELCWARAVAREARQPARRLTAGRSTTIRPTLGGSSARSTGTGTSAVPPRCSRGRTRVERLDDDEPSAAGALATASLGAWRRGDLRSRGLGERAVALDPGRARGSRGGTAQRRRARR